MSPKPVKRPKPRKHYAVLVNPRTRLYACPTCGPLGELAEGVAHAVAHQFVPEEAR